MTFYNFRFGLAGKNDLEAAQADQVVDALNDLMNPMVAIFREKNEERKSELKKHFDDETGPKWMRMMEDFLVKQVNHMSGNISWSNI